LSKFRSFHTKMTSIEPTHNWMGINYNTNEVAGSSDETTRGVVLTWIPHSQERTCASTSSPPDSRIYDPRGSPKSTTGSVHLLPQHDAPEYWLSLFPIMPHAPRSSSSSIRFARCSVGGCVPFPLVNHYVATSSLLYILGTGFGIRFWNCRFDSANCVLTSVGEFGNWGLIEWKDSRSGYDSFSVSNWNAGAGRERGLLLEFY